MWRITKNDGAWHATIINIYVVDHASDTEAYVDAGVVTILSRDLGETAGFLGIPVSDIAIY